MGGTRKAFLELAGEPLLLHALRPFLDRSDVTSLAVALPADEAIEPPEWIRGLDPRMRLVTGGATRAQSVAAALAALDPDVEIVLVHDAARPLLTGEIIDRCVAAVGNEVGAVAGWPVVDTLKEVDDEGWIVSTPDRGRIRHAQTPQAFPRARLVEAYRRAGVEGGSATDDAAVFERAGGRVRIVEGAPWNLKVTVPEDLVVAEAFMARRAAQGGGA